MVGGGGEDNSVIERGGDTLNFAHPGACLFHVSLACIHACCSGL